ncbi:MULTISPECIES: hypothetical protein [unclassified Streptomyces]|uniref:hypothetical protein n=1 Tax=unclassified Streptomyces TaxID=2593676 RepID=UPI00278C3D51|nr:MULTISPECIES: hypothetical protein [unclassified Streptomyces]
MTHRRLTRAAVLTTLTLMAFGATGAAQAVAAAKAPEPCHRYQATVNRHQDTIDRLDEQITPVEQRIEELEHDYDMAHGAVEYQATVYTEARDWVRELEREDDFDPNSADYLKSVKDRDEAEKALTQARNDSRAAAAALDGVEVDPQLLADRARAKKLLGTAEKRLASCLARPTA